VHSSISLIQTVGGLGIFLIGMVTMTDALKTLAGTAIRRLLMRFTQTPISGAVTGAACTALLQSSSATTVAAVGFVGAGLITFSSALGIVFGANLGTTITGWIVALVGFKLQLTAIMYPGVLLGALLRIFASGRVAGTGLAIAGFSLIFIGIEQMQLGMLGMRDLIAALNLPTDTYFDRLQLVMIGAIFTVITQSSSAGVAAVLTGLFTESLTLGQGLSLVIGMDIGTTVTAVLATLGGGVGTRRTGYSHFIYNVLTGVMAFFLIAPYVAFWSSQGSDVVEANTELILVAFHSGFNLLGVILVLPFSRQFARLMILLVPGTAERFTDRLDVSLLKEVRPALDSALGSAMVELQALFKHSHSLLTDAGETADLKELQHALNLTHEYIDNIEGVSSDADLQTLTRLLHVMDHAQRLHERCEEEEYRARVARNSATLGPLAAELAAAIASVASGIQERDLSEIDVEVQALLHKVESLSPDYRGAVMKAVAASEMTVEEATQKLEAVRWLHRVVHHVSHITKHLSGVLQE
jgi:phosphate:Na+ symporter